MVDLGVVLHSAAGILLMLGGLGCLNGTELAEDETPENFCSKTETTFERFPSDIACVLAIGILLWSESLQEDTFPGDSYLLRARAFSLGLALLCAVEACVGLSGVEHLPAVVLIFSGVREVTCACFRI